MVDSITEKTLTQHEVEEEQKGIRFGGSATLEPETRYALCLLKLANAVTPDDYAALAVNIKAVAGVVDIDLMNDRVTAAVADMSAQPDAGEPPVAMVPRERMSYNGKVKVIAVPAT